MHKNVTPKLGCLNHRTGSITTKLHSIFSLQLIFDIDYYWILFYSLIFIELKNSLSSYMIDFIKGNLSSDYDVPRKEIGYIVIFQN